MGIAQDLSARQLAVPRDADLVGHGGLGQLLFRAADVTDLGDRVDPDREQLAHRSVVSECMCATPGGPAPSTWPRAPASRPRRPRRRCGRRPSGSRGPTAIRPRSSARRPGLLEPEVRPSHPGGRRRTGRPRRRSACRSRAASTHRPRRGLDRRHLLAEAKDDAELAQVVLQALRRSGVAEVEHGRAFDHRDLRPERGEHRRVLDPDHAGPDDDRRGRIGPGTGQAVGIEDVRSSKSTSGGCAGRSPCGYHDLLRGTSATRRRPSGGPCANRRTRGVP